MKIEQNIHIHNRFDIEVRDKISGMVKQTAVAYNVITNGYFSKILDTRKTNQYYPLDGIAFGRGSGTPAVTDTNLFSKIARKTAEVVECIYAYPTSHITKRITLDADSYNGETITEVGFEGKYDTSGSDYYLMSHAMIQDSEGQQIAIHKTDTDVVYINATFFCSYTPAGFGDNGIYPTPANNILIKWVFGEELRNTYSTIKLNAWHHPLQYASDLDRYNTFSKSFNVGTIGTGDTSAKTLTLENASILSSEGGTQALRAIGFYGIGAFVFPDISVMSRYAVQNKTLDTGDGSTKDFDLGAPFVKNNTVRIFIDNVEQAAGVDYTVDYSSNGTDNCGNYHTAAMSLIYDREHIVFGDEASKAKSSYNYYDPICMARSIGGKNLLPAQCTVTQANPIWIDFSEAKNCNTLKVLRNRIPSGKEDSIVIEHSDDNANWTTVNYTRDGQTYCFSDVSARYWRVFISGSSWSYGFIDYVGDSSSILDGVSNIGATFFLGESKPALHFVNAPANGAVITASYDLDVPYKTENNLIRITVVVSLNRD